MKENSIKNERSSIKEAVKTMEHWVEYEKNNKDKINKADELIYIQETILSDYKRVLEINEVLLKENEILKEEKEQAWEEWNNLEQGSYETEQKIKQQIKKLQKENEELKIKNNAIKRESEAYAEHMIRLDNELNLEKEKSKYEWIRQNCLPQELVNKLYIPVQKVKDKIEEYKNMLKTCNKAKNIDRIKAINERILELQELLEGRK